MIALKIVKHADRDRILILAKVFSKFVYFREYSMIVEVHSFIEIFHVFTSSFLLYIYFGVCAKGLNLNEFILFQNFYLHIHATYTMTSIYLRLMKRRTINAITD